MLSSYTKRLSSFVQSLSLSVKPSQHYSSPAFGLPILPSLNLYPFLLIFMCRLVGPKSWQKLKSQLRAEDVQQLAGPPVPGHDDRQRDGLVRPGPRIAPTFEQVKPTSSHTTFKNLASFSASFYNKLMWKKYPSSTSLAVGWELTTSLNCSTTTGRELHFQWHRLLINLRATILNWYSYNVY